MITGKMTGDRRDRVMKRFENDNSIQVLFMTFKTGGLGLNFAKIANNVILLEGWWCPAVGDQASHRVIRIDQKKVVNIYSIIIENSIEEKIQEINNRKRNLIKSVLKGKNEENSNFDAETIGEILGK